MHFWVHKNGLAEQEKTFEQLKSLFFVAYIADCSITLYEKFWCNVIPYATAIYLMHFLTKWSLHKLVFCGNGLWCGKNTQKRAQFFNK